MTLVLDLGAGRSYGPIGSDEVAYVGLDVREPADVVGDGLRLPFRADVFDRVELHQVAEHVPPASRYQLWNEIWRVLVPGGLFSGDVPGLDLDLGMAVRDPTHIGFFVKETFFYLLGPRETEIGALAFHDGRTAVWEDPQLVASGWAYFWTAKKPENVA